MSNEADTCRRFVVTKLQAAGWDTDPHRLNEEVTFTEGRAEYLYMNTRHLHDSIPDPPDPRHGKLDIVGE